MLHWVQIKSCRVFFKFGCWTKKSIIFTALPEKQYQTVLFWLSFSHHGKGLINPKKRVVVQYNTKTIPGGFLTRLGNPIPCLLSQWPKVDCGRYHFSAVIERISQHSSAKTATRPRGSLRWWSPRGVNGESSPALRMGRQPSDACTRKPIAASWTPII